jgi:hypothetical protein
LHSIGESISEMLDWVPAQLLVVRIRRPKFACRACGTVTQAPAPERPIVGGLATPALLAQVLVSKYCDHTPVYRQAQILRATASNSSARHWLAVGGACWWFDSLLQQHRDDVRAEAVRDDRHLRTRVALDRVLNLNPDILNGLLPEV